MRAIVVVFLFCLISCGSNNEGKKDTRPQKPISPKSDTLEYKYHTLKEISPYLVEKDNRSDTSYYQITYPQFDRTNINNLINPSIFLEGNDNAEQAASLFIQGYNEFAEEISTQSIHMPWIKEVQSNIVVNTPMLFSLQTFCYEYSGGAHGNALMIWSNFDVKDLRKITLTDIISKDQMPNLIKIAEQTFRKQENLTDTAKLDKDFFFENGKFALNDNFGLTKDNLVFIYNEYEIKPYSEGSTTLEIPYTELQGILTKKAAEYIKSIK